MLVFQLPSGDEPRKCLEAFFVLKIVNSKKQLSMAQNNEASDMASTEAINGAVNKIPKHKRDTAVSIECGNIIVKDKYHITYWTCLLVGIGSLLPYSCIISSSDYFIIHHSNHIFVTMMTVLPS